MKVNLLPWREERRQHKQQEFMVEMAVAAILAVVIMLGYQMYLDNAIEYQIELKAKVDQKVAELHLITKKISDINIKKTAIENKIATIVALQKSRPEMVHFISEVATIMPEGVILSEVKQVGVDISLKGKTQSNARVSELMRHIEASEWLVKPEISVIKGGKKSEKGRMSDFILTLKRFVKPTEEAN